MRQIRTVVSIIFSFVCCVPAQSIDPQALLDEIRTHVAETVRKAPRYTCTELIERSWLDNPKVQPPSCGTDRPRDQAHRKLMRTDRLRLDVAVGSDEEMFSWHGEKRFQTEEIDKLVTRGPISSGTYYSFLTSVFLTGEAKIDYRDSRTVQGRALAVFGYSLPLANSKFETRTDSGEAVMGYHGEFTVDVNTHSLVQLTIISNEDEIPQSAHFCSVQITATYGTVVLNATEFQLPSDVAMDLLDKNRELKKTVTRYQGCHEFAAESTLRFDAAPSSSAEPARQTAITLPGGLLLRIRITSKINPAAAWAGDPVSGELADDMFDAHGSLIAPKGSPVSGRLLGLENVLFPSPYYLATVRFQELKLTDADYTLNLRFLFDTVPSESGLIPRRMQLETPAIFGDSAECRFRLLDNQANLKGAITRWVTN